MSNRTARETAILLATALERNAKPQVFMPVEDLSRLASRIMLPGSFIEQLKAELLERFWILSEGPYGLTYVLTHFPNPNFFKVESLDWARHMENETVDIMFGTPDFQSLEIQLIGGTSMFLSREGKIEEDNDDEELPTFVCTECKVKCESAPAE